MQHLLRGGALDNRLGWTPAKLAGLGPCLAVALSRSRGLLWQDTAKTLPASAAGDPVKVATCPFTNRDFTAASDAARPVLGTNGSIWYLTFNGTNSMLSLTSPGNTQVWCFALNTGGYTNADEVSGYSTATAAEQDVARLFPDINTWYSGNGDDVVAFTGGAGLINGTAGTSNVPTASYKVLELTRASVYTPTANYNLGSSNNAVTPRFYNGNIAAHVSLAADVSTAERARLRTWLGQQVALAL